jgi:hypothetical protein
MIVEHKIIHHWNHQLYLRLLSRRALILLRKGLCKSHYSLLPKNYIKRPRALYNYRTCHGNNQLERKLLTDLFHHSKGKVLVSMRWPLPHTWKNTLSYCTILVESVIRSQNFSRQCFSKTVSFLQLRKWLKMCCSSLALIKEMSKYHLLII